MAEASVSVKIATLSKLLVIIVYISLSKFLFKSETEVGKNTFMWKTCTKGRKLRVTITRYLICIFIF